MTSCDRNEADVFDKPATIRLSEAMAKYRDMLPANGWMIDYYEYDATQKVPSGGYAMYWNFTDKDVTMACEIPTKLNEATLSDPTLWDMVPDMGPVLSFNLYNPVLDYFCDASNGDLDGRGGDFEFIVLGETEEHGLLLKGKRRGLKMILCPVAAGDDPIAYLNLAREMSNLTLAAQDFNFMKNGQKVASVKLGLPRILTFSDAEGNELASTAFAYTTDGIRLYQQIEVEGVTLYNLLWDDDEKTYTDKVSNVVLACTNTFPVKPVDPPGAGTDASPYLVSTAGHLAGMNLHLSSVFKITADIDLDGKAWLPVGPFTGKLYGDNHKIKNIMVESSSTKVGLFSELGANAIVEGVNVVGGTISSSASGANIGGVVGHINGANVSISKCSNSAEISAPSGTSACVGGIVGYINQNYATIDACFNKGNITGGVYVGGIVGRPANAQNTVTITNCYSQADITSAVNSSYLGGIIGYMYNGGSGQYKVENCYATGTVKNTAATVGSAVGIAGRSWNNANAIIQHNVALQTELKGSSSNTVAILGSNVAAGTKENFSSTTMILNGVQISHTPYAAKNGNAVTLADAKTAAWYVTNLPSWDFTNVWKITGGNFPALKWEQ
ncbi:MAG: DUF4302 domain-containing protein [Tannerella sp.]|nr:DUF4302 domain-containing protein [Tannerella sp.]